MTEVLLAKSEPPITLKQHIEDGLSVWEHLRYSFPRAAHCAGVDNFWRLLWLSVVTHDLGKAHAEFQKVLRGQENRWFSQRHELFSLPFVKLLALSERERQLVLRVVAAHHKSYDKLRKFISDNYQDDDTEFEREFNLVKTVEAIALVNDFEAKLLPTKPKFTIESPAKLITAYNREVSQVVRGKKVEITDQFALLLMMGAFHHCDHLASGFITSFDAISDGSFGFLDRMREGLRAKALDLYEHQQASTELTGSVILTAPTGSGKTETAMLWLRKQLQQTGQGRVFYVLPFTASINAMFERLAHEEKGLGSGMVGMLHGNLDAYLYESFLEEAGNLNEVKVSVKKLKQMFKTLQTPLKVVTPFQLLKHLFGLKGFEKGIFEWVGGHFIFDEIHAYNPEITAQIVVLLEYITKHLDAKVFVMTATLPTFLKAKIGAAIGAFTEVRASSALYQAFERHQLKLNEGLLSENLALIENDLKAGKYVLVVCNTVDQARYVYEILEGNYEALLIHGRFAAKDRTYIEKQLQANPPQLLVGTQAIEVSLDIDYDVIYTEPAPLDALIQRFGRVNRKREKAPCPCIVFKMRNEKDKYIYEEGLIAKTLAVLEEIEHKANGVIQEAELQRYIDEVYPGYDTKAQEQFDRIYQLLGKAAKELIPFKHSPEREEDYYKQFDGIKVLPAYYEQAFKASLDEFDFIGARQLNVSIRKNWFARLINTPDLESNTHIIFPSDNPGAKGIEIKYYKINKWYRPSTGLDFERDEDSSLLTDSDDVIL